MDNRLVAPTFRCSFMRTMQDGAIRAIHSLSERLIFLLELILDLTGGVIFIMIAMLSWHLTCRFKCQQFQA